VWLCWPVINGGFWQMTDIFISYANEDRDRAAQVAQLLELEGWRVWWDRRIPAGRSWRSVLEDAVGDSRCMVVLWSKHSVKSPWVAEEAEEARRLEKTLMPVSIERVEPPMGFRAIQAADLVDWNGSPEHPAARLLIADLKSLLGQSEKADKEIRVIERAAEAPRRGNLGWLSQHASKIAFGAVVIAGVFAVWQMWPNLNSHFFFAPQSSEADRPDSAVVPRLTHLAVDAERRSIKAAETLKLNLKGQYSDGSQREVTDAVQWLSSDMRVATVDAHGEVKALQPGTTNISAKVGQVESAQWTLGVESLGLAAKPTPAPKLVALNITSSKYEFTESERVALRARGKFSDNSEKTLSTGVEWEISDRTIASVNERGELVARRPGKIKVVARSDELASSPLTLLIKETRKIAEPPPKPTHAAEVAPAKPTHPAELQPAKSSALSEQTKARIAAHMDRAQLFREQGNYAGALAELERAKAIDAANEEIKREIEQTKRACNAERVLGNKPNC